MMWEKRLLAALIYKKTITNGNDSPSEFRGERKIRDEEEENIELGKVGKF